MGHADDRPFHLPQGAAPFWEQEVAYRVSTGNLSSTQPVVSRPPTSEQIAALQQMKAEAADRIRYILGQLRASGTLPHEQTSSQHFTVENKGVLRRLKHGKTSSDWIRHRRWFYPADFFVPTTTRIEVRVCSLSMEPQRDLELDYGDFQVRSTFERDLVWVAELFGGFVAEKLGASIDPWAADVVQRGGSLS